MLAGAALTLSFFFLLQRHINTDSDSELILNVFAESLVQSSKGNMPEHSNGKEGDNANMVESVFQAMEAVMTQCKGGYAGMYLINGVGLVGFRDPHGIRPMVFGSRKSPKYRGNDEFDADGIPRTPARMNHERTLDYVMASESVAIDTLGFHLIRYVKRLEFDVFGLRRILIFFFYLRSH